MTKIFSQILFIFTIIFSSFSIVIAMDDGVAGEPGIAQNNALKRYCGLGLSHLSADNNVVDLSDEAKRAWGLYRSALWRKEVLEDPLEEIIEKFRKYGNSCAALVREKHCRDQAKSSKYLPADIKDVHKKALSELTALLRQVDSDLLETIANDKTHRAYKLPEGHALIKGLLEVKPFNVE